MNTKPSDARVGARHNSDDVETSASTAGLQPDHEVERHNAATFRAPVVAAILMVILMLVAPVQAFDFKDKCQQLAPGNTCDVNMLLYGSPPDCPLGALFSCFDGVPSCEDLFENENICEGQVPSCQDLLDENTCNGDALGNCTALASSSGQSVAEGLGTSGFSNEQTLEAVQQVDASIMDLCGDGGIPIGPSCVAHSERGVASVVCMFGCPWTPKRTTYRVMTQAIDSSPTVPQPAVYGAVSCWSGQFLPVPPFGVSCADNGYCSNEAEGHKWLAGLCIHLAAGDNPQIIDRECKY